MGKMSVSIYMKGYYEEFHAFGRRKNKANSKPIKLVLSNVEWSQSVLAPRPALGVERRVEKTKPICP